MKDRARYKAHSFADLFPMMDASDEAELRASMETHGYGRAFPVVLYKGKILDGRNRYAVATAMGLDPVYRHFEGDDDAALAFVLAANLARRHLTTSQRAMVAACLVQSRHGGDRRSDQAAALPVVSQYEAASRLGVSERSVRAAVKVRAADPELAERVTRGDVTVAEAEAAVRPAKGAPLIDVLTGASDAAAAARTALRKFLEEYGDAATEALAGLKRPHVAKASGDVEWYTPGPILQSARRVLGAFDLDPASSAVANERVKAKRFYTKEDDGRTAPWSGRVWLNPPYDHTIGDFVARLLASIDGGDVPSAITLTNNATETKWGQELLERAASVCYPSSRVRYERPGGEKDGQPLQGQMLCYFGPDVWAFEREFVNVGVVRSVRADALPMKFFRVGEVIRDQWRILGTIVEVDEQRQHAKVRAADPGWNGQEFYDLPLWWDLRRVPTPCVPARGVRAAS